MKKILIIGLLVVALGGNSYSKELKEINDVLSYDSDTKVVYYYFREINGYWGYGYMSPYISENGKYCRYINGEIVEVKIY